MEDTGISAGASKAGVTLRDTPRAKQPLED